MARSIFLTFIGLLFASCNWMSSDRGNYPNDPCISDVNGTPTDSLSYYLPWSIQIEGQTIKTEIDYFIQNYASASLRVAQEPILSNNYLGHDIYRFTWLRSFNPPVVISIHKKKNKVSLITKGLDRQLTKAQMGIIWGKLTSVIPGDSSPEIDLAPPVEIESKLVLSETKQLDESEWEEFEGLIDQCSFWSLAPTMEQGGVDGSEWIIEGHLKNKYWFVIRWTPRDEFRKLGEFLIRKSGIRDLVY